MNAENKNTTYLGITASDIAWSRLGICFVDGRPDYDSDKRLWYITGQRYDSLTTLLPHLIARAVDALPDGASGDKILARVATLAAHDKNIAQLGKLGEKIPTNINLWHHVPEIRAMLENSVKAIDQ